MKNYLQIFAGGFEKTQVDIKKAIEKIEVITSRKKIDGIIIGWSREKEIYNELSRYLKPKGIKLYFWIPVFSELGFFRKFGKVIDYQGNEGEDFKLQDGENFEFYCPNDSQNLKNVKEIFLENFSSLDVDGVFLDKIRYPSFSNGIAAFFTCFCETCSNKMEDEGIDVKKLKENIQEILGSTSDNPLGIKNYNEFSYIFSNELFNKYYTFKINSINRNLKELISFFKKRNLEVGLDIYAPMISSLFGQDIKALSEMADFIKPMYYRKTYAPAGIPFEIQSFSSYFSEKAGKTILNFCGENELDSNISDEYFRNELRLIREKKISNIYYCIDFNRKEKIALSTEKYLGETLDILEDSDGIVLSWDLMSIPEKHLELFLRR